MLNSKIFRKIFLFTAVFLIAHSFSSPTKAQIMDSSSMGEFAIGDHTCSYFGEDIPSNITTFASTNDATTIINNIIAVSGLAQNFQIRSGGVPNAAAVVQDNKRFILYNQSFMIQTRRQTGSQWGPISIMAHEVGHHLNGDTLDGLGSRPAKELKADYFSGFILQKLGSDIQDAQLAMSQLGSQTGSNTHPARHDRLAAIAAGWAASCEQSDSCDDVSVPDPGPVSDIEPNSCRWANDNECDEPGLCSVGTDTNDCRIPQDVSNGCRYANDGECDEPDLCDPGTDTNDCRGPIDVSNSCAYANDDECDEPDLCDPGTDTDDCRPISPNSCRWANDGECDEPNLCDIGTDVNDCRSVDQGNSCQYANDGECDVPNLCEAGTDNNDCHSSGG
jgi:hypothetical protein